MLMVLGLGYMLESLLLKLIMDAFGRRVGKK